MADNIRISISHSQPIIGTFGNTNYLMNYISHFEYLIPKDISAKRNGDCLCPNYAAWLRFYSEYISINIIYKAFLLGECKAELSEYSYNSAITRICEYIMNDENIDQERIKLGIQALKKVIELRHTIQHGGVPNILREARYKDVKMNEIALFLDPNNYEETKETFTQAREFLNTLPPHSVSVYADGYE